EVPTSAEVALPGLLSGVWYAMAGPPRLKPELQDQIAKATIEVLKMPDVQQRFRKLNVEPDGSTPAETAAFIKNEVRRWGEVIRTNHIMAEGTIENIISSKSRIDAAASDPPPFEPQQRRVGALTDTFDRGNGRKDRSCSRNRLSPICVRQHRSSA